ncbi:alpha-hydroxy acid oxidase [Raineyella sp. W15-4]|uniref:alpha-hydroxy acid oxidase n=1 Tax=Raineyella sp. W15-4 TaxID=3081651 RepID=UPI00295561D7|nr:alpha-hydroxy acid oxidase [Raineyella sp. W15-4]WOQ15749.1 alpha-hydroxy acid oxidase [Raineyella sp. W15-4]
MSRIVSVPDLQAAARRRLPRSLYDYICGGAQDGRSVTANAEALAAVRLRQRIFAGVGTPQTSIRLWDVDLALPLFVSPMGLLGFFHPGGDLAVARAAASNGVAFVHSAWSGVPLPDIVEVAGPRVWAQVSVWSDPDQVSHHLDVAEQSGVEVLVLAGDVAFYDKRDLDLQHGLDRLPPRMPLRDVASHAVKLGWLAGYLRSAGLGLATIDHPVPMRQMKSYLHQLENPHLCWDDVHRIRRRWKGRLVLKGVMTPEDAQLAIDAGVDGLLVSNHGGRQFNAQPGVAEVLPRIVDTVAGRATVLADGGVARGGDVAKYLGLGAAAGGIGRGAAWGLAAGGQPGVEEAVGFLREELATAMGFLGARTISDIDADCLDVRPVDRPAAVVRATD